MELLMWAYLQERLQEADQARLCRLARLGRAGAGHHRDVTHVRPAARILALGAIAVVAVLVAMVTVASLLVVIGQAPALG